QVGQVRNSAGTYATSFNRGLQYGPSLFDRRHVFNAIFNYDLPAGKGHRLSFSNAVADKFIAGRYVSGVFGANSRAPLVVVDGDVGGGPFSNTVNAIPLNGANGKGGGTHGSVCGTTGPNGATYGSAGNGPNCSHPAGTPPPQGSGINLFADPGAV